MTEELITFIKGLFDLYAPLNSPPDRILEMYVGEFVEKTAKL